VTDAFCKTIESPAAFQYLSAAEYKDHQDLPNAAGKTSCRNIQSVPYPFWPSTSKICSCLSQ
jgi:hypothetical protein